MQESDPVDKWRCPKCSFDNLIALPQCEICDEVSPHSFDKTHIKSSRDSITEPGINCPNSKCRHFNALTRDTCQKCEEDLFAEDEDAEEQRGVAKSKDKRELVACRYCGYDNDPTNDSCVSCQKRFKTSRILKKSIRPPKAAMKRGKVSRLGKIPCSICGEMLNIVNITTLQTESCEQCEKDNPAEMNKNLCVFCDTKLKSADIKRHDQECIQRNKFFSKKGNQTYERCSTLQFDTMVFMHKGCEKRHYRKEKQLLERVRKLLFTQEDLQNLHHYIMHYAPIIIHMHVNTHFHFFLADTHYRNQFQTNKSSGSLSHSCRIGWEDRMFAKMHHNASPFERVKYGTMNFTNDPAGVRVCSSYGLSYFLLKPHVRDRCTITDMDSSSASSTLGTFRFIYHLLMKLSDAELRCAFEGSKGNEMKSNVIGAYKQIQIHGPVQFARDIERVYICKDELKMGDAKALLEQVKSFCSKHSLEYQLFENDKMPVHYGIKPAGDPAASLKVDARMVGDSKQLTEEEMKPPPPPPPPLAFGGFGGGSMFPSSIPSIARGSAFGIGASHFAFGAPVMYPPVPPPKKKEYGVDYI